MQKNVLTLVLLGAAVAPAWSQTWTLKLSATRPRARIAHALVYDAARNQVVLFGGIDNGSNLVNDTWVWDGTNWTQKTPANSPPARYHHAMAYDAARNQVVLFGGHNQFSAFGDTWVWDGTNWSQKSPATAPPARYGHRMAYDAAHGEMVLFGGISSNVADDTWTWNGTNWTRRTPASSPSARLHHSMAYDAVRNQVVLFGGLRDAHLNDTWVWDGTNWNQKSPVTRPPARFLHVTAYDAAHSRVVLFGGYAAGTGLAPATTWTWDGTNWTDTAVGGPPAHAESAMAYDAARSQVVLFGGRSGASYLDNTWVYGETTSPTTLNLAAPDPASVSYGSTGPVSLSANLTRTTGGAAVAGGTVAFSVDGAPAGSSQTNGSGVATISFNPSALAVGSHRVEASFSQQEIGGVTYAASSATPIELNVTKAIPTVTVSGGTFTFDNNPHPATGSVTGVGGIPLGAPTITYNGSSAAPVAPGTYNVVATFAGNGSYQAATASDTITITSASSVSVVLSSTALTYPGSTPVVVAVAGRNGKVPGGTVTLLDGSIPLTTLTLGGDGKAYWYILPGLTPGVHHVSAAYSGDADNPAGQSAATRVTVAHAPVLLGASCWNASLSFGQNYSCSVNVGSNSGRVSGVITYSVDANPPVTVALALGNAQFTLTKPATGNHTVAIQYAQQGNFAASSVSNKSFTVTLAPVVETFTASTYWAKQGTPVTLTVALSSWSAGTPNQQGSVNFYDGATLLATVPVSSTGTAVLTTSSLSTGQHTIKAMYGGTSQYASATASLSLNIVP